MDIEHAPWTLLCIPALSPTSVREILPSFGYQFISKSTATLVEARVVLDVRSPRNRSEFNLWLRMIIEVEARVLHDAIPSALDASQHLLAYVGASAGVTWEEDRHSEDETKYTGLEHTCHRRPSSRVLCRLLFLPRLNHY